ASGYAAPQLGAMGGCPRWLTRRRSTSCTSPTQCAGAAATPYAAPHLGAVGGCPRWLTRRRSTNCTSPTQRRSGGGAARGTTTGRDWPRPPHLWPWSQGSNRPEADIPEPQVGATARTPTAPAQL